MKSNREIHRIIAYFTQFTINMLVPIFICSFAGLYIDKKLGTNCFFVILFFVGALAGFRNIYILVKRLLHNPDDEDKD